jgi:ABC-type cobalamin/Fe3+-siderophores transport system ATPase subunit
VSDVAFEARGVAFRYPRAPRPAIEDVSLAVPAGAIQAVIGPNGSGKSTLLRLLLGALPVRSGQVLFRGRAVEAWDRTELARHVGVVPQVEDIVFPLSVRELVETGRYPHLGMWRRPRSADRRAVHDALLRCDVAHLADRPIATLSGGERQRVRLARALAQQPTALALDEPTASLDIHHEMAILELLRALATDDGVTILVITHNINLAARYAHRILLLDAGRAAAAGAPAQVLTRAIVERVYAWPVAIAAHPGPGPDAGAPQVVALAPARQPTA